jgi:hypothetical protein
MTTFWILPLVNSKDGVFFAHANCIKPWCALRLRGTDLNAKTGNINDCKNYYQKAIERALSFLKKDRQNKQANLLLAAMRVDYANFLVDVNSKVSHDLILRTTDHLEAWLQEYPQQEEGWLYLAQSRTNEYPITVLSGDTQTAEIIRDQVLKTIAGMSKDSRKNMQSRLIL